MLKRINHIALVVPELDSAKRFWIDVMGLPLEQEEHVAEQRVDVAFMPLDGTNIELLKPTDGESGVAKYLDRRGPGMHHICFEVDDIDAALVELRNASVPLIDEEPRSGHDGKQYAFIHPKGTGGVLVELYQINP
ncbi:MAG: methylmalonyl-CoA epimerase [Chloroflexi bacterium]|nr:MAG: methylmalonyl-CoA epimerase [Chloroflexota bacterium]